MIKSITQTDLILYHYNECSKETKSFIENNIENYPDWKDFLSQLDIVQSSCANISSPNPTSINIILEESAGKEQHSF